MRGRKPIPSRIIELRGGRAYTHRPARDQEPTPPEERIRCPRRLDAIARKEWRRLAPSLKTQGVLTTWDREVFARYCIGHSLCVQLRAEIAALHAIPIPGQPAAQASTSRVQQFWVEYRRWEKAREQTAKGTILLLPNGKVGRNPYLAMERESFAEMSRIERRVKTELRETQEQMSRDQSELGLTPTARSRIKVETPKPMGKLERFMGRKNGTKG